MIRTAESPCDIVSAAELITEYINWLPFDLDFQDFESELADLAGHYGGPTGTLLLAHVGEAPVGVVGVRRFDNAIAELKRMYVQESGRGRGLGKQLAEAAIDFARLAGYESLRLDSDLETMPAANALYDALGFVDIERYRANHLPRARFMELKL